MLRVRLDEPQRLQQPGRHGDAVLEVAGPTLADDATLLIIDWHGRHGRERRHHTLLREIPQLDLFARRIHDDLVGMPRADPHMQAAFVVVRAAQLDTEAKRIEAEADRTDRTKAMGADALAAAFAALDDNDTEEN